MKTLIASLSVVFFLAANAVAAKPFPSITLPQLQQAIADKSVTLLDATGTENYRQEHIPGAIDYFGNEADIASKLPADKNALIVAYCYDPRCPAYAFAAEAARKLGYTNVKHFVPGIDGWIAAKQPTQKGS